MAIKDIVKSINKEHGYKITSDYWGRIGAICKRYGEKTVEEAVMSSSPKNIPLNSMLNIIEKKCQYILEHGEIDDLAISFLNLGDEQ